MPREEMAQKGTSDKQRQERRCWTKRGAEAEDECEEEGNNNKRLRCSGIEVLKAEQRESRKQGRKGQCEGPGKGEEAKNNAIRWRTQHKAGVGVDQDGMRRQRDWLG